jgi:hypothetical protein
VLVERVERVGDAALVELAPPSALLAWKGDQHWVHYEKVPIKGGGRWEMIPAADWPKQWIVDHTETELRGLFSEMGPMDVAVAAKYFNAMSFFQSRTKHLPAFIAAAEKVKPTAE